MGRRLFCRIILILCFFILSSFSLDVSAFDGISFKNISIEEGLSQATVETIIQDKKGYIWIGTNDGLNRYNGYDFKVFRQDKNTSKSLVNNYIVDLKEDTKGNIWVGTANGVSKIINYGEDIINYLPGEEQGNLSHYNIGDILILKDGTVLVGTSDGLNVYNEKSDSFERILKHGQLSSELIYSLDEDEEGNIWVATDNGLNKISVKTNEVIKYYHDGTSNSIAENRIYKVYCDKDGYVWVGTFTKGASRINTKTGEIKNFYKESWGLDVEPGEHIRNFFRDSNDILWICSSNGLVKYDEDNNSFEIYKKKVYDDKSLINDTVFVVMEDRSGMLWAGTYAGISIFDSSNKILHYKNDPFDDTSISDNMIKGIYEDDEGYLWVGTHTNGVDILDKDRNRVSTLSMENSEISSNRINQIAGYKNLVFMATNNGLNILDKNSGEIKVYKTEDGLISQNIRHLMVDDKNYLWIGSTDGFDIFNIETEEIVNINYILEKVNTDDLYSGSIFQDSEGIYWLGTFINGGLIKINPKTKEVVNYKYDSENKDSIIDNTIRCIAEDGYGNIWVGTSHGLSMLDKKTNKFKNYSTVHGLANNTIYGILIDDDNNPWVSTNLGISRYDILEDRFINLNITDGLQSNEFNGISYLKTKSGEFFFGGINGMNSFYPSEIKEKSYISKVVFDEFFVNGINVNDIDGKIYRYDENNIAIRVFLPEYKNSRNIRYYYNINGDDEWRLMDNNEVLFSKLSPGHYIFKVRAINSSGIESDIGKVSFTINMPRWISTPALLIYIFVIVFFIVRQREKVRELDELVYVKTNELRKEMEKNRRLFSKVIKLEKSKNSYLINLSHELRTPLNVLHTTEQLITKLNKGGELKEEKLDYYMGVMRRNNNRLLKLINNLIDISKMEEGKYIIIKKKVDIVYIVEEAALSLIDYIEENGITLVVDPEVEEKIINCDAHDIERCIINLISNAVKFTPVGGEITVLIEDLQDTVRIVVKDTGIGISEEYLELIFNRFNQVVDANAEVKGGSGLGLTITKQIINLHDGIIYVESEVGKGSSFIIELPV